MATLNFKGKTFVQNHHLTVKYHQLVPKKNQSLTNKISLNDNLIIHGDNLKALKALLPTYAGKVKCIYIDPPYNTGNEKWVYNDNVNSPMMQEWLGKVVDREDLTRHDKWLCMMMPRLKLLRELLRDDGVIFVSIDDNEVHHLRMLMDEVFGENNFIANIVWQARESVSSDTLISLAHHHLLFYTTNKVIIDKNKFEFRLPVDESKFSNPDNDPRGAWVADPFDAPNIRPNLTYAIINPNNDKEYWPPKGRCWRTTEKEYKQLLADERIVFGKTGKGKPQLKRFLYDAKEKGFSTTTWWDDCGTTTEGTKELEKIFGEKVFNNPKPQRLIQKILTLATDKDSLILDSFAGSGTTAHAVLDLNQEDGGNRKFILVECEDYADKITAERVRRVIKGYSKTSSLRATKGSEAISEIASSQAPRNDKKGLGGSFSYFELGDPIEMESILEGKKLPSYLELARYIFYTATGEEFNPKKVIEKKHFIGESKEYEVYLFYKPDIDYLKSTALTLDVAKSLGPYKGKKRLVFAPSKYLDTDYLLEYRIDYCQLPFEIYKLRE